MDDEVPYPPLITRPSPLILASASPRRLELLKQINIIPSFVEAPLLGESPCKGERPNDYTTRLAAEKVRAVAQKYPDAYILAADTVVACGRRILPKAENEATARKCLTLLSGRRHRVYTAIALHTPAGRVIEKCIMTRVAFRRLMPQDIDHYIQSGEWEGKAGGYAIQGLAAGFIPWINGSYSNVVGLPLYETRSILGSAGFTLHQAKS